MSLMVENSNSNDDDNDRDDNSSDGDNKRSKKHEGIRDMQTPTTTQSQVKMNSSENSGNMSQFNPPKKQ